MTAQRFTANGQSLQVTVNRVHTRPGALQLKANAAMTPEVLLEVAEWLKAQANQALADNAQDA